MEISNTDYFHFMEMHEAVQPCNLIACMKCIDWLNIWIFIKWFYCFDVFFFSIFIGIIFQNGIFGRFALFDNTNNQLKTDRQPEIRSTNVLLTNVRLSSSDFSLLSILISIKIYRFAWFNWIFEYILIK